MLLNYLKLVILHDKGIKMVKCISKGNEFSFLPKIQTDNKMLRKSLQGNKIVGLALQVKVFNSQLKQS